MGFLRLNFSGFCWRGVDFEERGTDSAFCIWWVVPDCTEELHIDVEERECLRTLVMEPSCEVPLLCSKTFPPLSTTKSKQVGGNAFRQLMMVELLSLHNKHP